MPSFYEPMIRRFRFFLLRICFILLGLVAVGCSHKVVLKPNPDAFNNDGLAAFHSGTPEGYKRAAEAFRRGLALRPESCAYALNLAQALWFLGVEQQLNFEEY